MKRRYIKLVYLSMLFCIGYLLVLINSYYSYSYYSFSEIDRVDLIARLPFMSNTTGFLYYPLVILIFIVFSLFIKNKIHSFKIIFLMLVIGFVFIGLLFYSRVCGNLVFGNIWSILFGIFAMFFSFMRIRNVVNKKYVAN